MGWTIYTIIVLIAVGIWLLTRKKKEKQKIEEEAKKDDENY